MSWIHKHILRKSTGHPLHNIDQETMMQIILSKNHGLIMYIFTHIPNLNMCSDANQRIIIFELIKHGYLDALRICIGKFIIDTSSIRLTMLVSAGCFNHLHIFKWLYEYHPPRIYVDISLLPYFQKAINAFVIYESIDILRYLHEKQVTMYCINSWRKYNCDGDLTIRDVDTYRVPGRGDDDFFNPMKYLLSKSNFEVCVFVYEYMQNTPPWFGWWIYHTFPRDNWNEYPKMMKLNFKIMNMNIDEIEWCINEMLNTTRKINPTQT